MTALQTQIHTILNDNLKDYITAGDITFVADKISKAVDEETGTYDIEEINDMITYISNDDCYFYQYKNEQSIVKNIIKLAINQVMNAIEASLNKYTVTVSAMTGTVFGHTIADFQSDLIVENNSIKGTLTKLTSGDLVDAWGEGYFIAVKFEPSNNITYQNIKAGMQVSYGSGLVQLDQDLDGAWKVTDKDNQKFVVQITVDDKTYTNEYRLDELVLNA